MEAAARHFEQEENILLEFEQRCRNDDDFLLLSSIYTGDESDGYVPYGKISFGPYNEICLEEDQLRHPASSSPSQPILCNGTGTTRTADSSPFGPSSLKPHTNLDVIAKVRFTVFCVLLSLFLF